MTIDQNTPGTDDLQGARTSVPTTEKSATRTSNEVGHTRAAGLWVGVTISAVLLVALIVFLAQNQGHVTTSFLGYDGSLSLALTVLIAAVVGALFTAIPATIRIMQLRRAVKRGR